jgi:hypothetical protein
MITTRGKQFFKRYLANQAGQVAGAVSVGIGNTAASTSDERLQFEFARVPLELVTYDAVNDRLVFKGALTEDISGTIYEVGLWTAETNIVSVNQEARIITTFDSVSEDWDVKVFDSVNTRIGADSLKHTPAASATTTSVLSGLSLDFVDNTSQDSFVLAYQVDNAFVSNIKVRFRTDASNYYEYTVSAPTVGFKFSSFLKSAATVVGTPDWADINEVSVSTTSTAGGAASVEFEGLRIEDNDTFSLDYGLIARFIPATPVVKPEGQILDFEYSLAVTV